MILHTLINEMHMSIDQCGACKIAVHKLVRLLGLSEDSRNPFGPPFEAAFGQLARRHGWEYAYEDWGFFVMFRNRR